MKRPPQGNSRNSVKRFTELVKPDEGPQDDVLGAFVMSLAAPGWEGLRAQRASRLVVRQEGPCPGESVRGQPVPAYLWLRGTAGDSGTRIELLAGRTGLRGVCGLRCPLFEGRRRRQWHPGTYRCGRTHTVQRRPNMWRPLPATSSCHVASSLTGCGRSPPLSSTCLNVPSVFGRCGCGFCAGLSAISSLPLVFQVRCEKGPHRRFGVRTLHNRCNTVGCWFRRLVVRQKIAP